MPGNAWELYEYPPSFVIGFHGCSEETGEAILSGRQSHLKPSRKKWDWLGPGVYFWEGNPQRALEWAQERYEKPFVVSAILDLGRCLDLLDSSGLQQVQGAYATLETAYRMAGQLLPDNKGKNRDKTARILDCLVIDTLHTYRVDNGLEPYETLRAVFPEGDDLYPGAGFRDKNHIQICIHPDAVHCIKGYFRPIRQD